MAQIKWTKWTLVDEYNKPHPEIKDKRNSKCWRDCGYHAFACAVFREFGSWETFLNSMSIEPIGRYKWRRDVIIEEFHKPHPEIKEKLSSSQWVRAGFGAMVNAIRDEFGGWQEFLEAVGEKPKRLNWAEQDLVDEYKRPHPEIQDKRNSAQWIKAGYCKFVWAASRKHGSWPVFLQSMGENTLGIHDGIFAWTRESVIAEFEAPHPEIKDKRNQMEWIKAGHKAMTRAAREFFGSWHAFLADRMLKPLPKAKKIWRQRYVDWKIIEKIVPNYLAIKNGRDLSRQQTNALFAEVGKGNGAAREYLIIVHQSLVDYYVKKMTNDFHRLKNANREYLDYIVSFGSDFGKNVRSQGLLRAVELYENTSEASFQTYASRCIKWAIMKEFKKHRRNLSLDQPLKDNNKSSALHSVDKTMRDMVFTANTSFEEEVLRKINVEEVLRAIVNLDAPEPNKEVFLRTLRGDQAVDISQDLGVRIERLPIIVEELKNKVVSSLKENNV